MAFEPRAWTNFFSALVSAGAALLGLLFVSISINLQRILGAPQLVARAGKALATATMLPVVAVLGLIPGQSTTCLGWELVGTGVGGTAGILLLYWKSMRHNPFVSQAQKAAQLTVLLFSTLPFVAAGVSLLTGSGGGLVWVAVGAVAALLAPVIDAWVLLIEIQR